MPKLRVAVIGVGNMGRHHARVYSEMPQVELVAVCDVNEINGRELAKKHGCAFYRDYAQMLAENKVDAISIAVPTSLHKKVACDLLNRKINVLLEKPLASNLQEAHEIIDAASAAGVKLMVGHIEKFNPAIQRLKEIIDSGRLGKIVSLNIQRIGGMPKNTDVSVVLDLATHDISISNYLLNSFPVEVHGLKLKNVIKNNEDSVVVLMKYANASSFIEANWITTAKVRQMRVVGTKGYAQADYINQTVTLFENSYWAKDNIFNDFKEYLAKASFVDEVKIGVIKKEPLRCELEEFIASISNDREPLSNAEDGYKTLEIALKI